MARKRTEFGQAVEQRIIDMVRRGLSAQAIAEALAAQGVRGASERTIRRRKLELRAGVNAGVAARMRAMQSAAIGTKPAPATSPAAKTHGDDPTPSVCVAPRSSDGSASAHLVGAEPDDRKATAKDRQIDELMSRSLAWQRIQHAIATTLASYPSAAAAVVRALREVQL